MKIRKKHTFRVKWRAMVIGIIRARKWMEFVDDWNKNEARRGYPKLKY